MIRFVSNGLFSFQVLFSSQNMSVVEAILKKHDPQGKGLTKKKFQDIAYDLGHYLDDAEVDQAFFLLDASGDGLIDASEFRNFWRNDDRFDKLRLDDAQLSKLQQMGDYFRFFDSEGTGDLNEEEFRNMTAHMEKGGYDLKKINFSYEALDANGDGKVSFNEYVNKMIDLGALDAFDGTRPVHG